MRKSYFLVSVFMAFIISNLIGSFSIVEQTNIYQEDDSSNNDLPPENYLSLIYQNGTFYSWNQSDNLEPHIVGIFNSSNQSYLLDSRGVFYSLDYKINKFYRINDDFGVAQFKFQKGNFIIKLEDNKIKVVSSVIASENSNFTILNKNSLIASGIGLDLINIVFDEQGRVTTNSKNLIPPYSSDQYFPTSFTKINENSGIFIGNDQYFYLIKDITNNSEPIKINLKASNQNNNVVVISENNLVLRSKNNVLYFVDISQNNDIKIYSWMNGESALISNAKNIAFVLNDENFILNSTIINSSVEYGSAFLVEKKNWNNLQKIPNIKTISDLMFINKETGTGIFIDKDLQANNFIYANQEFIVSKLGTINNFQFINKNLFFATVANNNLLVSQEPNKLWKFSKSVQFKPNSTVKDNLLNNIIISQDQEVSYQNTYFANGPTNIVVTSDSLLELRIIDSKHREHILRPPPNGNSVTFYFSIFDDYEIIITFFEDIKLKYQVNLTNFAKQELLKITSSNSEIISYVGVANDNLYDIRTIDQKDNFTIANFNYHYLLYAELATYDDTNMVLKNLQTLASDSKIEFVPSSGNLFFGVKLINLVNEVTWIYLGFRQDSNLPMIDFWDTKQGKDLMNQALMRRYLERDLRALNAEQIKKLIGEANNWRSISTQGKAIVFAIVSTFGISIFAIIWAIIRNIYLNKKIAIEEFEQNRAFKNILDS